jgi:hypothetical protein
VQKGGESSMVGMRWKAEKNNHKDNHTATNNGDRLQMYDNSNFLKSAINTIAS